MIGSYPYDCEHCKGHFYSEISMGAALEEMHARFGDLLPEDRVVVCDDCYRNHYARYADPAEMIQ